MKPTGHIKHANLATSKRTDPYPYKLIGQRVGRLVVVSLHQKGTKNVGPKFLCKCDCGNEKVIPSTSLHSGDAKSCGCLNMETLLARSITHGMSKTPIYRTWFGIKSRCTNVKNDDYEYYGGRGITICDRWLKSFENFFADMGERPEGTEIDRIDNNKGYSPENCRWVTHKQNCRNFRQNRIIEHLGRSMTLVEWSEETGINQDRIRGRLNNGWSTEKALTAPANSTRSEGATRGLIKRYRLETP